MINNPSVWGPYYWFFLHTICLNYPDHPNNMIKKKYYDLIMNFPLFIPNKDIADMFEELLDTYPVNPYLENKHSFIKWTHFIHNEINKTMNKPTTDMSTFITNYYNLYKPSSSLDSSFSSNPYLKGVFFILLIYLCYKLYRL
tara:strand:+ start:76 stop:501 length:426 start_codon:yes stop_codon:yes gene_type:complete